MMCGKKHIKKNETHQNNNKKLPIISINQTCNGTSQSVFEKHIIGFIASGVHLD